LAQNRASDYRKTSDRLAVGASFAGPAIVEQFDATSVVPPGWRATVDRYGSLILERRN
jgi:N-methylhydantoinase A/oxoprolinase/acetone carboxylase beta subunit